MYLIHAQLKAPPGGDLPSDAARRALALTRPGERIEHVTAHPHAVPDPILGIFVMAESLFDAEALAAALCHRLLDTHTGLADWGLRRAEAPLSVPLGHGPLGPPESSSHPSDLRRE
ncbi:MULTISPECIES: hypothetical protein [Streptomyces]|uniref:hypothetical protein n=1 Tax=Streptomyces TaxID=1883 RepID=UPI000B91A9BA|nr:MULTISPECIES: hypothetical protein [Streptomyces]MBK3584737.1 hypothetical protein [Streptomyces sp. MBT57]WSR91315.1 hypothetical protein OG728_13225 [Streptomyces microflavus]